MNKLGWIIPALMALVVVAWNLRGWNDAGPVLTDAARHAMNSVSLHDLIAEGQLANPSEFAKEYYRHFPALSMPNHPPVFPVFTAGAFFLFGVSGKTALAVVAIFNAIAVLVMYRLAMRTHGSPWVATAAVITFFFHMHVQRCASDIMLELPTLAFTLAAALCLAGNPERLTWPRAVGFALLASVAIWTKQNAIFLIVMPWAYAILDRRWSWLVSPTLWLASIIPTAALYALIRFSQLVEVNSLTSQATPPSEILDIATHHIAYYAEIMAAEFGLVGVLILAAASASLLVLLFFRRNAGDALHFAWLLSAGAMLLSIGAYDPRYAIFGYIPLIVLGYVGIERLARGLRLWSVARWSMVAVSVLFAIDSRQSATYTRGIDQAANLVASQDQTRVLYCGKMDGTFIFRARLLDPERATTVVRGDKLDPGVYASAFDSTLRRYGIRYVVMETRGLPGPWLSIAENPPKDLRLLGEIPLEVSPYAWGGTLMIYRFEGAIADPVEEIPMQFTFFGAEEPRNVEVDE